LPAPAAPSLLAPDLAFVRLYRTTSACRAQ